MESLKIAALGLAAVAAFAPAAGVFAADQTATLKHVDVINLTVDSTCTLGTLTGGAYNGDDATTHNPGNYDDPKTASAEVLGTWHGDTLALTMQPGTKSENIGSTTFTVRCNNAAGYDLKVASKNGALKKNETANIPGGAVSDTASFYAFKIAAEAGGMTEVGTYKTFGAIPTSETKIAGKASAGNIKNGEKATVTYAAGVSQSQESGDYNDTVTYTLTQL